MKYTNNGGQTCFGWVSIYNLEGTTEVRLLQDVTRGDLLGVFDQTVVYHDGDVCRVAAISPLTNDEWPIAAMLPDGSDYWYLRSEWYEVIED